MSGQFSAATDFKVGEAIEYIKQKGYGVTVFYNASDEIEKEEKRLIYELGMRFKLLNDLRGYNYLTAREDEERKKIQDFVDQILKDCVKKKNLG